MPPAISVVIPAYNAAELIEATLLALQAQHLDAEIIVVDDASSDATAACVGRHRDVRLLRLEQNQGRAAARNAGAGLACAEVLLFLDCDRVPAGPDFLSAHLSLSGQAADGACGTVEAAGSGFWARYQNHPCQPHGARVPLTAFSSANFSIRRSRFHSLGGFDTRYRRYGFEDRDFYARLLAAGGHLVSAPDARAQHIDQVSLAQSWQRLQECGEDSADRFRSAHPEQYRRMAYWYLDAGAHPLLWPFGRCLGWMLRPTLAGMDRMLAIEWLPFALRSAVAKAYSAAAFLYGTTRRR